MGCFIAFLSTMEFRGTNFLLPIMLQRIYHYTPFQAALSKERFDGWSDVLHQQTFGFACDDESSSPEESHPRPSQNRT